MTNPISIVYVMHPFSAKTNAEMLLNLDRADKWCAFLTMYFGALFVAPWVPLCRHWSNSGEELERGMSLDFLAIKRSDACIMVGGRISTGMTHELGFAEQIGRTVFDASRFETPNQLAADDETMALLTGIFGRGHK